MNNHIVKLYISMTIIIIFILLQYNTEYFVLFNVIDMEIVSQSIDICTLYN